jgi:type II secretory pathway component PulF
MTYIVFPSLMVIGFGVVLYVSLQILYGPRRRLESDPLRHSMLIAAWVLIVLGGLGFGVGIGAFVGLFVWGAAICVAGMIVSRRGLSERRSFLWYLASAAKKGLPLESAARAFALERNDRLGNRVMQFANYLRSGVSPLEALVLSRIRIPLAASVSLYADPRPQKLSAAFEGAGLEDETFETLSQPLAIKTVYPLILLAGALVVMAFLEIKILPMLAVLSSEVGGPRASAIELWTETSGALGIFGSLAGLLWGATWIGYLVLLAAYLGIVTWEPPLIRRLWIRYHGAHILRAVADCAEENLPIARLLDRLSAGYPRPHVRNRLNFASGLVHHGMPWTRALREAGLVSSAHVGVLEAAERSGNLAWASRELAYHQLRKLTTRLSTIVDLLLVLCIALVALPVALVAIAVFQSLTGFMYSAMP